MSRWVELYATSPSGKTLFVCRICGRKSPTPDRTCTEPPEVFQKMALSCELIEEMEAALEEEKGNPEVRSHARVLVISEKASETPRGTRSTVVWSTLTERYRSTEVHFEKEQVLKKES